MAQMHEGGTEMKRRKRFTIKLVALGFAVTALAAPTAQARLDQGSGSGTKVVSPDDRPIHGAGYSSYTQPSVVLGADDRSFNRMSPVTSQSSPVSVSSDDGFELGTLGTTGIILALGAGVALIAVRSVRRHKLVGA
jgi:hypothetical protein